MLNDKFGNVIYQEHDIVKLIYNGHVNLIENILTENTQSIEQFKTASDLNLKTYHNLDIDLPTFDSVCQSEWFMPKDYCPNLVEMLYSMCSTSEQTARVSAELELFIQHGMYDLLHYLKYLVDTLRENNILWGVGRGSSVSSYVLFLIGVHKVDSIKYDLDIHEFLR